MSTGTKEEEEEKKRIAELRRVTPERLLAARKLYREHAVDDGNTFAPGPNKRTGKPGGSPWTGREWNDLTTAEQGDWIKLVVERKLVA